MEAPTLLELLEMALVSVGGVLAMIRFAHKFNDRGMNKQATNGTLRSRMNGAEGAEPISAWRAGVEADIQEIKSDIDRLAQGEQARAARVATMESRFDQRFDSLETTFTDRFLSLTKAMGRVEGQVSILVNKLQ